MNIDMKLVYLYMTIFFNFLPTLNHLHPLQVENCDSISRLVVDEDDNGKFRLERVKGFWTTIFMRPFLKYMTIVFNSQLIQVILFNYESKIDKTVSGR